MSSSYEKIAFVWNEPKEKVVILNCWSLENLC
jgi:hypothetical protein